VHPGSPLGSPFEGVAGVLPELLRVARREPAQVDEAPLPGDVSDSAGVRVHVHQDRAAVLKPNPAEVLRRGHPELATESLLQPSRAEVHGLGDVGRTDREARVGVDVLHGLPEACIPRGEQDRVDLGAVWAKVSSIAMAVIRLISACRSGDGSDPRTVFSAPTRFLSASLASRTPGVHFMRSMCASWAKARTGDVVQTVRQAVMAHIRPIWRHDDVLAMETRSQRVRPADFSTDM